jgi:protein AroM
MLEKAVKLCLVTIGQSPRPDLWDEIGQTLKFPFEVYHFGLLDSPDYLDRLLLDSPDSDSLVTQLRTGDVVRISSEKAHQALQNLIGEIIKWEKPDGIIILCTGILETEATYPIPVFYPGILIQKMIMEKLSDPIGVILPDKRQWPDLDPQLKNREAILFEINPPGTERGFLEAADYMNDRKITSVVFHCMGYPLSPLPFFSPDFMEQIVHPRLLISQALNQRFGNI